MLFRFPDCPMSISLARLKELDAAPAGAWLAQPKLDGWRHVAIKHSGRWAYYSKHGKESAFNGGLPASKTIHFPLRAEFEALPWPDGIGLDAEWYGPRHKGTPHSLHVFDLLYLAGFWVGELPFEERYAALATIMQGKPRTGGDRPGCQGERVRLMPCVRNPGLMDYFAQQLTNPFSEGLVVRSASQTLLGSYAACADNPYSLKIKMKGQAK